MNDPKQLLTRQPRFYWSLSNHGGSAISKNSSTLETCCKIAVRADKKGLDGVLITTNPRSWDAWSIAGYLVPQTKSIRFLIAQYTGVTSPLLLAQQTATLTALSDGRIEVNAVSGKSRVTDYRGNMQAGPLGLTESQDYWGAWRQSLGGSYTLKGTIQEFNSCAKLQIDYPLREYPLMVAGSSDDALALAVSHGDCWLKNAKSYVDLRECVLQLKLQKKLSLQTNEITIGLRLHILIRQSNREVLAAAQRILELLRKEKRISSLTNQTDDLRLVYDAKRYIVDSNLWDAVGRFAAGPGLTLIGTPKQVRDSLAKFYDLGASLFILSGYDNETELEHFAEQVLPFFR